jgi:hypothetical protein
MPQNFFLNYIISFAFCFMVYFDQFHASHFSIGNGNQPIVWNSTLTNFPVQRGEKRYPDLILETFRGPKFDYTMPKFTKVWILQQVISESWTLLQHICPHFWAWLMNTIAITPKSEDKYVVKVFNWSEVHCSEMYKSIYSQVSIKRAGCIKRAGWNIFEK